MHRKVGVLGGGAAALAIALALIASAAGPGFAVGNSFAVVNAVSAPGSALNAVAASSTTDVWAAGTFRPTGNGYGHAGLEPFAEHFNGTAWTQTPIAGTNFYDETINGLAVVSTADVWAVGVRKRTGFKSPVTTLAYHWNGASWSEVATPAINATRYWFTGVSAVSASDVWAVGIAYLSTGQTGFVEHFSGTAWSVVTTPLPAQTQTSTFTAVSARARNDVWVVGSSMPSVAGTGFNGRTLVEHWNGTAWSVVPSRDASPQRPGAAVADVLTSVTAIAANDVWAVGYAVDTVNGWGTPWRTVVEHWNGTQWALVANPQTFDHPLLSAVVAAKSNDVWAVGWGYNDCATCTPIATPILQHWAGTSWAAVAPFPNVGGGDNLVTAATALGSGDVWLAGSSPQGALLARRTP